MVIDPTITTGNILQIIIIVSGGLFAIWEIRTRMAVIVSNHEALTQKTAKIAGELEQLAKLAVEIARQDERMAAIDRRLEDMFNRISNCVSKPSRRKT
jgi:hypothetical protein